MARANGKGTSPSKLILILFCTGLLAIAIILNFLWTSSSSCLPSSYLSSWYHQQDPQPITLPNTTKDGKLKVKDKKGTFEKVIPVTFSDIDAPQLEWEQMASAPVPQLDGVVIQIGNLLFVFAGYGTIDYLAQIAGCKTVVLATPPSQDGSNCKEVLYCAKKADVTHILKAGGAQAISAMAWGTETYPKANHTVHMVYGLPPTSMNATATTNVGGANTTPSAARGHSSNEGGGLGGAGLGASLFPILGLNGLGGNGGSGGLFGDGIPEFEQMQQQLTQNPNMMREIMNMPTIQNLVNNPDILRNMIMSNPQMREIIDRNPELAHILNYPNTLRQTLEAARNPELMREMMRNTGRAMRNIESSPEGFNMLRRMYETIQEPFLNATTLSGETGNDAGANPFAALLGNQGGGQVRDPYNPSNTGSETTTGSAVPNTYPLPNPWGSGGGVAPTNATACSGPATGLSGLGLLDMFGGGMLDPSQLTQFLQNPVVSQMMQSLLSNPQAMNQVISLNPQLRSLVDSKSQFREMMQNPDFMCQLANPEIMQQVMNLQQSLLSTLGRQQPTIS